MANEFARQLRKAMTDAERRLWWHLRGNEIAGARFRRQAPIENYIVDFVCFDRKVIIELDGGQHAVQVERDTARTAWLNSRGFRVLRFWNHQIFEELDPVLEAIGIALTTPHPNPPPQGGRGSEGSSEF
ncbi:MAG TPA: endonuclease domain-containing protein, partial [Isosphaeraceae bacterium]